MTVLNNSVIQMKRNKHNKNHNIYFTDVCILKSKILVCPSIYLLTHFKESVEFKRTKRHLKQTVTRNCFILKKYISKDSFSQIFKNKFCIGSLYVTLFLLQCVMVINFRI